jgi:tRNA (uracil-5-)-methyltransferase
VDTVLVDPPREGCDASTRALLATFRRVLYISCCPETLARDVAALGRTHTLRELAVFDQFPYTPHLEMGLMLERTASPTDPIRKF